MYKIYGYLDGDCILIKLDIQVDQDWIVNLNADFGYFVYS